MNTIIVKDINNQQRLFDLKLDPTGNVMIEVKMGKVRYIVSLNEINKLSQKLH